MRCFKPRLSDVVYRQMITKSQKAICCYSVRSTLPTISSRNPMLVYPAGLPKHPRLWASFRKAITARAAVWSAAATNGQSTTGPRLR
jgi:hypothetical protein